MPTTTTTPTTTPPNEFVVDFTKTVDGLPDACARWEYARHLGRPCEGAAFRELCRLYRVARRRHEAAERAVAAADGGVAAEAPVPPVPPAKASPTPPRRALKQATLSFAPLPSR